VHRVFILSMVCSAFVTVSGCATVEPARDYRAAETLIRDATGSAATYLPGNDASVQKRVAQLLDGGLTVDEAVQICLLNNRTIQAAFYDIGVARSEVVQSGLLSNPTLGLSVRFPEGGGRSNLEAGIAQNIVDLWQIPVRKRVAEAELTRTILDVANTVSQVAADTKAAYYAVMARAMALQNAEENTRLAEQLLTAAQAQQRAGTVSELDVNLARGVVLGAKVAATNAQLYERTARRRLLELLGIRQQGTPLELISAFPGSPATTLDSTQLMAIANDARLDLRAARSIVVQAKKRVAAERQKVFPEISVGLSLERSERRGARSRKILADTARASIANGALSAPEIQPRSERRAERKSEVDVIMGPSLDLTLPIFDQNQAQIAGAAYRYAQAQRELDALELAVAHATSQAIDDAETAWRLLRTYEDEFLPQAEKNLEFSRQSYQSGRTSLITVLDAQRSLLETRDAYTSAQQNAALAVVGLERETARPFQSLLQAIREKPEEKEP